VRRILFVTRPQDQERFVDLLDRPDDLLFEGARQVAGILDRRLLIASPLEVQIKTDARPRERNHRHAEERRSLQRRPEPHAQTMVTRSQGSPHS
jgi:hypothetical protein